MVGTMDPSHDKLHCRLLIVHVGKVLKTGLDKENCIVSMYINERLDCTQVGLAMRRYTERLIDYTNNEANICDNFQAISI